MQLRGIGDEGKKDCYNLLHRIMEKLAQNKNSFENSGFSKEIAEFLSRIDYEELRSIYAAEAIRSGVDPEKLPRGKDDFIGFIDAKEIKKRDISEDSLIDRFFGSPCVGGYNKESIVFDNTTFTLEAKLDKLRYRWGGERFAEKLFLGLCHEEAHASSANISRAYYSKKRQERVGRYYTGYDITETGEGRRGVLADGLFKFFNEGVTELIATEVYDEYLRGRTLEYKTPKGDRQLAIGSWITEAYKQNQAFVKELTQKISQECGVPEDVVWNGIKQGYFKGFDVEEWDELFAGIIAPGFLDELSTATKRKDISSLPRMTIIDTWSETLRIKWMNLLSNVPKE